MSEESNSKPLEEIVKSKDFRISAWKLVLSALIIPLINGFSLMMKDWLSVGQWDWTIMLIIINAITIPAIINWLTTTFNLQSSKTISEYEALISKNKEDAAKVLEQMKDERDAYKIRAGLSEYALEQSNVTKPDYDKYTQK